MPRGPGWIFPSLLGLGTLLARLPFLTPRLAHWDAVNYALGLHEFNVAAHQPHPPGSPYYILLGRAALAVTGDDNAALILVSLVASVGAVLAEYVLARALFGQRAGFLAAMLLLSQPVFWGYGTMATPWTLLACLALLIGLFCLRLLRGAPWLVMPSALLMGVASGFRLDVTVFLGPLWVWAVWQAESRATRRLLAMALATIGIVVWLVPVALNSGGAMLWSERLLALLPAGDTSAGGSARQLGANTAISFGTLAFCIGPAVALSLVIDRRAVLRWLRGLAHSELGLFWLLWIAPAFLFLWLIDSTEPGHDLVFAVALCALGAGLVSSIVRGGRRLMAGATLLVAVQVGLFLFAAPQFGKPLAWTANSMLLNVTAPGLGLQQTSLSEAIQRIRGQFAPRDTVILTIIGQDPYRFMMYYLPEFRVLRLDPSTHSALAARFTRQGTWTSRSDAECVVDDGDVRHAVWVLSPVSEPGIVPAEATLISTTGNGPFQVWALEPGPGTRDYLGFNVGGNCAIGS